MIMPDTLAAFISIWLHQQSELDPGAETGYKGLSVTRHAGTVTAVELEGPVNLDLLAEDIVKYQRVAYLLRDHS